MERFNKLRYKLMAAVLALMALALTVETVITQTKSLTVIRSQSLRLSTQLIEAGVERIETSCSQFNSLYQSIYLNEDFKELLRSIGHSDSESAFVDSMLSKSAFLSTLSSRSDLYSIIFVDIHGRLFYASRDEAGFYEDYRTCDLPEDYITQIDNIDNWKSGLKLLPTTTHMPLRNSRLPAPKVYTAARKILNTEMKFAPAGIMFITVDLSEMERLSNLMNPDDKAITYISNNEGRVIYGPTTDQLAEALPTEIYSRVEDRSTQDVELDGQTYIMVSAEVPKINWNIITLIPESIFVADALSVSTTVFVTAIISLIIGIIMAAFVTDAMSRPIETLANEMDHIGLDNLNKRVPVSGSDEIAQLSKSFNLLLDKLGRSIEKEYELELKRQEAVIQVLQSQLNPHFLYNVLQSIGSMAMLNDVTEISTMATALGNILRYSINGDAFASVRDEIGHVSNYLLIQKIRYQERLHYYIDIPEYVQDVLLPRVSLQPIVENAIIHGFEQQQDPGTISIRGWMENNKLVIEVSDDGQGINSEQLSEINTYLEHGNTKVASSECIGIGISNLNERLKLLYKPHGILKVESEHGIGTVVQIEVPVVGR